MKYIKEKSKITCIDDNGKNVGEITFPEKEKGIFDINHTFVDESMQGKGIAAKLVRYALNEINMQGGKVTASCSYAKHYIEKHGLRPIVICHMVASLDGKVTGDFLYGDTGIKASEHYYEINRKLKGDAFACGRVTMESSFTGGFKPELSKFSGVTVPDGDYIAMKHNYYAVSFDTCGNVGWTDSKIHDDDPGYDDCHIIEVISEKTPEEVLAYYRSIGVSYIFAGSDSIDIKLALNKLYSNFGIKKLLLEGGSVINGAFEREDMIDELSLVTVPIAAGKNDKPLFADAPMSEYSFLGVEALADGAVWSKYEK